MKRKRSSKVPATEYGRLQLAASLALGDGVAKDEEKAASIYSELAEQGSADAAYNLATMYERGEGVAASERRAMSLYRKAEKLGSTDASVVLGELALRQRSRSERLKSLKHFALAAAKGDVRALSMIACALQEIPRVPQSAIVAAFLSASASVGHKESQRALRALARR